MKTDELQLGNWVTDGENGFPMYVDGIFRDSVYLNFSGNEGDVWESDEKDLRPIKLTDDIFEKSGFKFYKDSESGLKEKKLDKYCLLVCKNVDSKDLILNIEDIERKQVYGMFGCNYVHELQNAVKLVTNKKIEIKL